VQLASVAGRARPTLRGSATKNGRAAAAPRAPLEVIEQVLPAALQA
jgi:hypothetical protein